MIKQSTVYIAQPIAERLASQGLSIQNSLTPLIKGLNDCSASPFPYTLENAPVTIPEFTKADGEHSILLEEGSNVIADGIRKSFQQIKTYLKPFAINLINELASSTDSNKDAVSRIFFGMQIDYRKLDYAFMDSPLYPTVADTTIDYSRVPLNDVVFKGKVIGDVIKEVVDYIPAPNADIKEIFSGYCPGVAFNNFIVKGNWEKVFSIFNGQVDFKTAGVKNPNALFTLYVIFTKLKASDEPAPFIQGLSLTEYRQYVNRMYNYLTVALVFCKKYYDTLKLTDFPVFSLNGRLEKDNGIVTLKGMMQVGVTGKAITKFSSVCPEGSISEALIGKAYDTIVNKSQASAGNIVDNCDHFIKVYNDYLVSVKNASSLALSENCRSAVINSFAYFQKTFPEFKEKISGLNNDLEYRRLYTALSPQVEPFIAEFKSKVVGNGITIEKFVMGSDLVAGLGSLLGMVFAADLLRTSSQLVGSGSLTEVQKREALSEAVIKTTVKHLIK